MLTSVYIENIALIKRLSLDLNSGFCAFTGETGAGKSIIIDSLGLLCGARSDKEIIRSGEDYALVEGIFYVDNKKTLEMLEEIDVIPDEEGNIAVLRKISKEGPSFAKINGRGVNLSRLKEAASLLISIHGQQDTQSFADSKKQKDLLDSFADNQNEVLSYKENFLKYKDVKNRLDALNQNSRDREYRADMLKYRINELKKAKIFKGEKEELVAERTRLANAEKIVSRCGEAYDLLYSGDMSASEKVDKALSAINSLAKVLSDGDEIASRLESVKYEIIDISDSVKNYIDFDGMDVESRLDLVENRIELIKKLENKYNASSDDFDVLLKEWEEELNLNENSEEEILKLSKELDVAKELTEKSAEALLKTRTEAAEKLGIKVKDELFELDMEKVRFVINVYPLPFEEFGADNCHKIEFLISANQGEDPKPISKIASGGELSRIMLCLKCVFAHSESIGTLIFDEIDTGVSGTTSEKIAIKLKNASDGGKTQVICVTHSAILAAKANWHYKISKNESDGRTVTSVSMLDYDGRRNELARIMGGLNITETVVKAAEEMLGND